MSRKELQQLFLEFQELNGMMQQLEKQQSLLGNQVVELMLAKQNLDELKTVKKGSEILVPVAAGVYAKALLEDTSQYVVNIGSNITAVRNVSETQEMLQKQIDEMQEMQEALAEEMQENTMKASAMEYKIKALSSQKQ